MLPRFLPAALAFTAVAAADSDVNLLPAVTVHSARVANQSPVATFAMPVSALRFEPRVDVQGRNFAEGQADVSIRGGLFENTGFSIGANSLFDPQTGHYFAEIPVAPAMLTSPEILTGAGLAGRALNATTGVVAYDWRPIRTGGVASVGAGEYGLFQAELYQGWQSEPRRANRRLAADLAWAHSDANGSMPSGDHALNRINARLQLAGEGTQTDLFAGYQAKFFGWRNLYTPFNYDETEDLETLLLALDHRVDLGGGDFVRLGSYYRRNRDEYILSRQNPQLFRANHTTWVRGVAANGRRTAGDFAWNFDAAMLADELTSTSLTAGRYHTRTLSKFTLLPERDWQLATGRLVVKAGATYDDSNRTSGVFSPVLEVAREMPGPVSRLYASYAAATQLPTYTALNSSATSGLFRGNANLGRETSRNLELGAAGVIAGWSVQTALFHRRDDDLVDWTFRRGVTARTANAVDISTMGIEAVAQRSWRSIDLVVGYTWLDKNSDYRGAPVDASFYALNYARQRLTAAIRARLTAQLELTMDNEVRVQAANLLRTRGGDRPIISSLGLIYRPWRDRRVTLSAQVDNLWDSTFQEVPAVPAARRQLSGVVTYAW